MRIRFTMIIFFALIFAFACGKPVKDPNIAYYTCPMHHQIRMDEPGQCPICHMTLVPVYKQDADMLSHEPTSLELLEKDAQQKTMVAISADKQREVGIKTAVVVKKSGVRKIRAFGSVAFDPDLAVAETEFVEALKGSPELLAAARRRLMLMGVSDDEILTLENTRKVSTDSYLPEAGSAVWVYAALFENDVSWIKPGLTARVMLPGDASSSYVGEVMSVSPVVDTVTRTTRVRIMIKGGIPLKPGTNVAVGFEINTGEQLMIPKSAYIETGERKTAYVVHDGARFEEREIITGVTLENDIVVMEGLDEGENVAAGALFLVDSEARLRGNVMREHQH